MGSTDEKREDGAKKIPRNPNIPIKDEEVDLILKQAAEQISRTDSKSKAEKAGSNLRLKSENVKDNEKPDKAKATIKTKSEYGKVENNKKPETVKMTDKTTLELGQVADNKKPEAVKGTVKKTMESGKTGNDKKPEAVKGTVKKTMESGKTGNDKKPEAVNSTAKKTMESGKTGNDKKPDTAKSPNQTQQESMKVTSAVKTDGSSKDNKGIHTENAQNTMKGLETVTMRGKVGAAISKFFDVLGSIMEGIWILVKLAVLVIIFTAVVGFFMSRDLLVRGRSGERLSTQGMKVTEMATANMSEHKKQGRTWSQTANLVKMTLEADDGSVLVARKVVTDAKSDKWAVILHGHNGSMEDIYDIAMRYTEEGYNVLMPDLRANGESEGSFYGMGWLDRLDVINWIDVILKENASAQVVIHGIDIGADTALMLAGEPLKSSIKAIVAEGAYTSARDAIEIEYKLRHPDWPVFPMVHTMNPVMKVWAGYTLEEADAVAQVQKTRVPILLIRGENDTYITADMTMALNQAIASEHEVLTIANGTHEDCRFADPDTYYDETFEFVERYIE